MRLRLLAVGRLRAGPFAELQRLYAARIVPPPAVVEIEVRQRLPAAALKAREAQLILEALPAGARLIALDEGGALWSSRALSERLAAWRDQGVAELAFAIGGADGLGAAVFDRAEATLSLGPMTWPHLLVRGMLLEQLYRAQQILAGHPYHRE
ncbi:MAG TPA: 23S rRNA (pseudouridine(1915)-N(3))-methyltransferase RlmH [Stellaceae bacterium]|nr:23S rRNA (pseudouridine(1915)-N(3))-methyltransferase RlmH [Stellaceae bacterium]